MTSESDKRAAEAFAADGFEGAFLGVAAFDADVFFVAGCEAFAAGCAATFFTVFFTVFFVGIWFSQTKGSKTYPVLTHSGQTMQAGLSTRTTTHGLP